WKGRYKSIVDLESHLYRSGTRIVKVFLHLSKAEQKQRFLERIDNPEKNWKVSPDDLSERAFWKDYRTAYEECLSATSTKEAPWYVVPADDKNNARLLVSEIILNTFRSLDLAYPKVGSARKRELQAIRKKLMKER
ncbi:MAG: polyphosphate kinase 2 family protein, partial [Planctomycetota bacterium]|nr:polyphosphate kinase 2 family protein [Planctomycetota bacterium]